MSYSADQTAEVQTCGGMDAEPILPIRRTRKLRRAPETPGGPLALKDVLILVSFLSLASSYENMNDHFF